MGRKKIRIEEISDERNKSQTFKKRKNGIMKKAMELSVLCGCEIALVVFNSQGRLFEYASRDVDATLARHGRTAKAHESVNNQDLLRRYFGGGEQGAAGPGGGRAGGRGAVGEAFEEESSEEEEEEESEEEEGGAHAKDARSGGEGGKDAVGSAPRGGPRTRRGTSARAVGAGPKAEDMVGAGRLAGPLAFGAPPASDNPLAREWKPRPGNKRKAETGANGHGGAEADEAALAGDRSGGGGGGRSKRPRQGEHIAECAAAQAIGSPTTPSLELPLPREALDAYDLIQGGFGALAEGRLGAGEDVGPASGPSGSKALSSKGEAGKQLQHIERLLRDLAARTHRGFDATGTHEASPRVGAGAGGLSGAGAPLPQADGENIFDFAQLSPRPLAGATGAGPTGGTHPLLAESGHFGRSGAFGRSLAGLASLLQLGAAVGSGAGGGGSAGKGSAGKGSGGKGLSVVIPEGPESVNPLESPAHVNVNLARLLGEASARGTGAAPTGAGGGDPGADAGAAGAVGLGGGVGGGAGAQGTGAAVISPQMLADLKMHSQDFRDLHGLFSSQGGIFSGSPLSPGMLAWPSPVANLQLDGSGHYPALAVDPPVDLTVVGQGIPIPPGLINGTPASAGGKGAFPGSGV